MLIIIVIIIIIVGSVVSTIYPKHEHGFIQFRLPPGGEKLVHRDRSY